MLQHPLEKAQRIVYNRRVIMAAEEKTLRSTAGNNYIEEELTVCWIQNDHFYRRTKWKNYIEARIRWRTPN